MVSISPVPNELPGPVSYFQRLWPMPVPAAPLKSSLQVSVNPGGGAGTEATAGVDWTAVPHTAAATTKVSATRENLALACMAAPPVKEKQESKLFAASTLLEGLFQEKRALSATVRARSCPMWRSSSSE